MTSNRTAAHAALAVLREEADDELVQLIHDLAADGMGEWVVDTGALPGREAVAFVTDSQWVVLVWTSLDDFEISTYGAELLADHLAA